MRILKKLLITYLLRDATLKALLGNKATAPYGLYYINPPKKPNFPYLVYHLDGDSPETNSSPDVNIGDVDIMFTWNGPNWDEGMERLDYLMERLAGSIPAQSDRLMVSQSYRTWASPEMWDDTWKIYHKSHRYLVKIRYRDQRMI